MLFKLLKLVAISVLCVVPAMAQEIVSSHAFSADELIALPATNWITNGNPGPGGPPAVSPDVALQADLDNGSTIYDNACVACHGETGEGGPGAGPALTANLSLSEIMLVINDGRNTMPAFDVFTDQELIDISTFVAERLK